MDICPKQRGRNRRRFDKSIIHFFVPSPPCLELPLLPCAFPLLKVSLEFPGLHPALGMQPLGQGWSGDPGKGLCLQEALLPFPRGCPKPGQGWDDKVLRESRAASHRTLPPAVPESTPRWELVPCPHGERRHVPEAALPLGQQRGSFFLAGSSSPAPTAWRNRLLGPCCDCECSQGIAPLLSGSARAPEGPSSAIAPSAAPPFTSRHPALQEEGGR